MPYMASLDAKQVNTSKIQQWNAASKSFTVHDFTHVHRDFSQKRFYESQQADNVISATRDNTKTLLLQCFLAPY